MKVIIIIILMIIILIKILQIMILMNIMILKMQILIQSIQSFERNRSNSINMNKSSNKESYLEKIILVKLKKIL